METHKTTAKVGKNGKVVLDNLPFAEGVKVEVTVHQVKSDERPWPPEFPLEGAVIKYDERVDTPDSRPWPPPEHPMKNSVIRYDDPFEPACPPEEWEALQ